MNSRSWLKLALLSAALSATLTLPFVVSHLSPVSAEERSLFSSIWLQLESDFSGTPIQSLLMAAWLLHPLLWALVTAATWYVLRAKALNIPLALVASAVAMACISTFFHGLGTAPLLAVPALGLALASWRTRGEA